MLGKLFSTKKRFVRLTLKNRMFQKDNYQNYFLVLKYGPKFLAPKFALLKFFRTGDNFFCGENFLCGPSIFSDKNLSPVQFFPIKLARCKKNTKKLSLLYVYNCRPKSQKKIQTKKSK